MTLNQVKEPLGELGLSKQLLGDQSVYILKESLKLSPKILLGGVTQVWCVDSYPSPGTC